MNEKAVALKYDDASKLPEVVAGGVGAIARQIVALAQAHGVPIDRNPELADLLSGMRTGCEVPPLAFRLVAEILCFLYEMDERFRQTHAFMADASKDQKSLR